MEIEERAKEKYPTAYDADSSLVIVAERDGYIKGATEQQEIDIEKACGLYEEALYQAKRTGIHGIPQMVNIFKQAMEE